MMLNYWVLHSEVKSCQAGVGNVPSYAKESTYFKQCTHYTIMTKVSLFETSVTKSQKSTLE